MPKITIFPPFFAGMIDFNFLVLRECVDKVFEVRNKSLQLRQDAIEASSVPVPKSSVVVA